MVPSLSSIKVDREPTQPLTDDEYARLLESVQKMGLLWNVPTEIRLAVIKLMRWAGPSAQDAITMRRSSLQHDAKRGIYRRVPPQEDRRAGTWFLRPSLLGGAPVSKILRAQVESGSLRLVRLQADAVKSIQLSYGA